MKLKLLILFCLFAFLLSACAPFLGVAQRVVELPEKLQIAITAFFIFLVGLAFTAIGNRWPWFTKMFGQYADEVAYTLAGAVIVVIQNQLAMIPPGWEEVANQVLILIVAILAALQVFRLFGKAGVKGFRK